MQVTIPLEAELNERLSHIATLVNSISAQAESLPQARALHVVATHRDAMQVAMAALGQWILDFEASHPSPESAEAARRRLTAPLHAWAHSGPAHARALEAMADEHETFELVEVLRRQTQSGADIPAIIFNDFLLNSPMTRAFLAHINQFGQQLRRDLLARHTDGRSLRVVSLHYSGGAEVEAVAEAAELAGKVQLTLVDRSSESLRDAQQKLSRLLRRRIVCERRDPQRYVEEPRRSSDAFHVIYAVSVFDVVSTPDVVSMLCGIHPLLRPGGVVLAGNATTAAPAAEIALRRWWLGWEVYLRDEAAWQAIAARTPFGAGGLQCISEPSGMGLIIRGEKSED